MASQRQIIDRDLFEALVAENERLRIELAKVASVAISSMFNTHRSECDRFSHSVLKGVAAIVQSIEVSDLTQVYEHGYQIATEPSVISQSSVKINDRRKGVGVSA